MKRLLIALLLFIVSTASSFADTSKSALEYKVKAVVLFNFAKYVQWPAEHFTNEDQSIKVCLLGENPFGDIFQSKSAPKEAQGRPLEVILLDENAKKTDVSACQMLFWTKKMQSSFERLEEHLSSKAILTVSDQDVREALISFVLKDEKVRFKIDYERAKELGFKISSQLLKLAILKK